MEIRKINQEDYNKLAKDLNQIHYLHSKRWSEFREDSGWGYDFIGFYKDNKLKAAANLRFKKVPKVSYFFYYIPRGFIIDYKDYPLLKEVTNSLKKYLKDKKAFMFKIDPDIKRHTIDVNKNILEDEEQNYELINQLQKMGYKHQGYHDYNQGIQPRYTFRVYLKGKTEKDILKGFDSSNKYAVKQAQKKGVQIVKGNKENLDEFMDLMNSTKDKVSKTQEFLIRDKQYFEKMYDYYDEDSLDLYFAKLDPQEYLNITNKRIEETNKEIDKIEKQKQTDVSDAKIKKLNNMLEQQNNTLTSLQKDLEQANEFIKEYPDGLNLGACMFIKEGDKIWYSYSARNYDYNKIKAVEYILYYVMCEYAQKDYQWLDLFGVGGDISKDSPVYGLYAFKKAFGGEYLEWIGEFDYIINKPVYKAYKFMVEKNTHEQKGIKSIINKLITRK